MLEEKNQLRLKNQLIYQYQLFLNWLTLKKKINFYLFYMIVIEQPNIRFKYDADLLKNGADNFDKQKKKLVQQYEKNAVYELLTKKITDSKDSITLIQQLKSSATDKHWKKLMKETGIKFVTSIKSMTLEEHLLQIWQNSLKKLLKPVLKLIKNRNEEEISKIVQA